MECPICKLSDKDTKATAVGDRYDVDCPRCGKYTISETAVTTASHRVAAFALSGWIRSQVEAGCEFFVYVSAIIGTAGTA
jgi:hypothetical protein